MYFSTSKIWRSKYEGSGKIAIRKQKIKIWHATVIQENMKVASTLLLQRYIPHHEQIS